MIALRSLLPLTLAGLLSPTLAFAEASATIGDRVDQVFETFTGDPAAGVDIDMKHVLDKWRSLGPKPLEKLTPAEARKQPMPILAAGDLAKEQKKPLVPGKTTVREIQVAGAVGQIPAQVIAPSDANTSEPLPVVLFLHGGGFVLGESNGTNASARAIANSTRAIIVVPDYRLAPEAKFPAAPDDCAAVYHWLADHAADLGGRPDKIALVGEGAGGMLAVDAAIAARDNKWTQPVALVLITPAAGTDLKTNSWLHDSAARPWNKAAVEWALNLYLPNQDSKTDPRIDLIGKADLRSLPTTTIVTAEIDPLRSDGERLGGKLKRATVPVSMRDYTGVTHDFFGMGEVVEKAATAQRYVKERLDDAFAPHKTPAVALENLGIAPYPTAPDPVTPPKLGLP